MTITQEQFDSLLSWLNADRELAGKSYETIRSSLVRMFALKASMTRKILLTRRSIV